MKHGLHYPGGDFLMKKNKLEKQQQKKEKEKFNSITESNKVVNQNQTHNAKREGLGPINQER